MTLLYRMNKMVAMRPRRELAMPVSPTVIGKPRAGEKQSCLFRQCSSRQRRFMSDGGSYLRHLTNTPHLHRFPFQKQQALNSFRSFRSSRVWFCSRAEMKAARGAAASSTASDASNQKAEVRNDTGVHTKRENQPETHDSTGDTTITTKFGTKSSSNHANANDKADSDTNPTPQSSQNPPLQLVVSKFNEYAKAYPYTFNGILGTIVMLIGDAVAQGIEIRRSEGRQEFSLRRSFVMCSYAAFVLTPVCVLEYRLLSSKIRLSLIRQNRIQSGLFNGLHWCLEKFGNGLGMVGNGLNHLMKVLGNVPVLGTIGTVSAVASSPFTFLSNLFSSELFCLNLVRGTVGNCFVAPPANIAFFSWVTMVENSLEVWDGKWKDTHNIGASSESGATSSTSDAHVGLVTGTDGSAPAVAPSPVDLVTTPVPTMATTPAPLLFLHDLQLDIRETVSLKLIPTIEKSMCFWVPAITLNCHFVSLPFRPLVAAHLGVLWGCILSLVQHN